MRKAFMSNKKGNATTSEDMRRHANVELRSTGAG